MLSRPARRVADIAALFACLTLGGGVSAADLLAQGAGSPPCDPDDGGLTLPQGFCALVVADDLGAARHLVVEPDGDIYVAIRGRRGKNGGVIALRDSSGDGKADIRLQLVEDGGGTGLALRDAELYYGRDDAILRYHLSEEDLSVTGPPEAVVVNLPSDGSHAAKSVALTADGSLFVNIGSRSNACQEQDRSTGSPGLDPCPEIEVRAGVWRFPADATDLSQADGERWSAGLRNTVALAYRPVDNQVYGVVHGRDQLHANWPKLFTEEKNAETPSEELVRIQRGNRHGWPECYHDPDLDRLVLAPEYGGDGQIPSLCVERVGAIATYPAHWAPNALQFYSADAFPERYHGGAFIAFHGSWNRAPLPQGGYNIVFQPFDADGPTSAWEVFADGFDGGQPSPRDASHRPSGLAVGPDGSLYVADDSGGRIWRIVYRP